MLSFISQAIPSAMCLQKDNTSTSKLLIVMEIIFVEGDMDPNIFVKLDPNCIGSEQGSECNSDLQRLLPITS